MAMAAFHGSGECQARTWHHSMDLESARQGRGCRDWDVKAVGAQRD